MFDASILFPSVALFRNRKNAGIKELPLPCKQIFVVEVPIEFKEQLIDDIFVWERISKLPKAFRTWLRVFEVAIQKTHER